MNYNEGNVFLVTDFDDHLESGIILPLITEIQKQRRFKDGRIDMHINSFGGYTHLVFQLVALLENAKRQGVTVRTYIPSVAYSCGSILAVAGTPGERYIEKDAEHLMHYGQQGSFESTPEQVERNVTQKREHFRHIKNHYLKYTKLSGEDLDKLMNDDSAFITASKAIKFGLADKYGEKFDIGFEEPGRSRF